MLQIIPNDIDKKKWCQNMFPKAFFQFIMLPKINIDNQFTVCNEFFFHYLQTCIEFDSNEDGYLQCIYILLQYAALLHSNVNTELNDSYLFLKWFKKDDLKNVLLWEQNDNFDRTMFQVMEHLKFDRIVFSTVISHLVTVSFETLAKCKNLIYYFKLLCEKQSQKPVKYINEVGISENDAKKLRQIFEHVRISRNILDDPINHPLYSILLKGTEDPYRSSTFTNAKQKPGHKSIFIKINDNSSPYSGLLLFDTKKSKTFELDYLNSLMLFSLARDSEYVLVDTILFRHDLLLSPVKQLYDPLSGLIYPFLKKLNLQDYSQITNGINQLIKWSKCIKLAPNAGKSASSSNQSDSQVGITNSPSATEDEYEKYSSDFSIAVSDSLLYHYQVGDIDSKFQRIRERYIGSM